MIGSVHNLSVSHVKITGMVFNGVIGLMFWKHNGAGDTVRVCVRYGQAVGALAFAGYDGGGVYLRDCSRESAFVVEGTRACDCKFHGWIVA